jgi:hypothetical protein
MMSPSNSFSSLNDMAFFLEAGVFGVTGSLLILDFYGVVRQCFEARAFFAGFLGDKGFGCFSICFLIFFGLQL